MRWEEEAAADGVSGLRGRSLQRPAFRVPRHPPWFQVVGNSGLGPCHVLLCSVARAGGGGDLLTKPRTWRPPPPWGPQGLGLQVLSPAQQLQGWEALWRGVRRKGAHAVGWGEACSHSWDLALHTRDGGSLTPRPLGCVE